MMVTVVFVTVVTGVDVMQEQVAILVWNKVVVVVPMKNASVTAIQAVHVVMIILHITILTVAVAMMDSTCRGSEGLFRYVAPGWHRYKLDLLTVVTGTLP
jgi:hypothetical protein